MVNRNAWICALALLSAAPDARAQEGLATSSTVRGHNTIQQAPSGGRAPGAPGNDLGDRTTQGQPTPEEREIEQRNDAATSICKGC